MKSPFHTSLNSSESVVLSAEETASLLPYGELAKEIELLLKDDSVEVPPRLVQPLTGGASLFVMPALDANLAIAKLITFTPSNAGTNRPTIQGDVMVFDISTGVRRLILDGPTVTARRTAAVSLVAAKMLACNPTGPLLIVGAGVQGRAHLEAFVLEMGIDEVMIVSRSEESSRSLADYAISLGVAARVVTDPDVALAQCPLVVTCTPANAIVLKSLPRTDAFVSAVGAFTSKMAELSDDFCRYVFANGRVIVDTSDAFDEAGDLLNANIDVRGCPTLKEVIRGPRSVSAGPTLFKSCGWAGWDLAAARTAVRARDANTT